MELLIVLSIIGILASIAIPSYRDYVIRGEQSEVKGVLLDLIQAQESFYVQNQRYASSTNDLGYGTNYKAARDAFSITIGNCVNETNTNNCALITATDSLSNSGGNITINTRGERTGKWD